MTFKDQLRKLTGKSSDSASSKKEKRKSKGSIPQQTLDPDHPPGARDVGFRKSFAITGDGKNHGGESGRNSPTTMANTAANATLNAMNQGKAQGSQLEVPKGGQGKMQTLDKYAGQYDSVSPRTQTQDSVRKISEDLDLTASGPPPAPVAAKQPDLGPINETHHAAREEGGGFLEPTTTRIDAALDPNFSTTSDPAQTHILPLQNRDFLTTADTHHPPPLPVTTITPEIDRPGHPLEKQDTNVSSIYGNALSPATTNLSDAHIPLEKTNTRDSYYTQDTDDEFLAPPDHNNALKPRPMTLQQEYSALVDLPLTPLPSNTAFEEQYHEDTKHKEEEAKEVKDESDIVTPKIGQGEFQNPILKTPEEEKDIDPNAPSRPGDFLAAIQSTFPDAAPNTAPVPVSPKDLAASGKQDDDNEPPEYKKHVYSTDGYVWTKGGHPPKAKEAKSAPDYSPTGETSPADETILAQYQTLPGPPESETGADAEPRTVAPEAVTATKEIQRPNLAERDTEDLIRQTPGGFVGTPVTESLPETANQV